MSENQTVAFHPKVRWQGTGGFSKPLILEGVDNTDCDRKSLSL